MRIPAKQRISIKNGATPQYDENGKIKVDMATCGTCKQTWNDALITSRTPVPSGRCPYEYWHPRRKQRRMIPSLHREYEMIHVCDVGAIIRLLDK